MCTELAVAAEAGNGSSWISSVIPTNVSQMLAHSRPA